MYEIAEKRMCTISEKAFPELKIKVLNKKLKNNFSKEDNLRDTKM